MDDFREWLSDNLRYILLGLFIILVLGLVFLGIRFISSRVAGENGDSLVKESQKDTASQKETDSKTSVKETETPEESVLKKDQDTSVRQLVNNYYAALGKKDIEGIKKVVDVLDTAEETRITSDSYIENYSNVETYMMQGPEEGTWVVYAVYTYKFRDIDREVPGLSQLYVAKNEKGQYYISTQEQMAEVQSFISKTMEDDDVKKLINSVQTKYENALEEDEKLKAFVDSLDTGAEAGGSEGNTVKAASDCNIRQEPSEDADIIGSLSEGQEIEKTGEKDKWTQVSYEGKTGYILSELLQ